MTQKTDRTLYDMVGIGFGPSNLALAIAMEEQSASCGSMRALFLDKQEDYQWHGNTLVSQSDLQISFLKDLVSLRNPESPYSFINYLHKHQRLVNFINLGTLYPCRMEFNDYLRWAAGHFKSLCQYDQEVRAVEPIERNGIVEALRVVAQGKDGVEQCHETRSVVISTGGKPHIPEPFRHLGGNPKIFHHANYKPFVKALEITPAVPMRIAIIGGGQSAAEAFIDLNDCYPSVSVDWIIRGSSVKPSDDTPFVNEIFDPEFTDLIYRQDPSERARYIQEYQNTNYAVVDLALIERIYGIYYLQKVDGQARHRYRRLMEVVQAEAGSEGVSIELRNKASGEVCRDHYDAVILATGYDRDLRHELLSGLDQYLGEYTVGRDYRLQTDSRFKPAIYMQGFCELTHGLSDTLLSVLPYRSEEIATSLHNYLYHQYAPTEDNEMAIEAEKFE
ncbi:lysine N(6)-hydroxylase/L-ornithine N(5)-oxygenase family protein [Oceanobacter antarcticus]|uniref:SidA/IucD/PvdA family monooxygenase n=1 Tax=Oceanobacter antarcticus TaxID=3133425 RepID=A0ABW8NN23_9GAMM